MCLLILLYTVLSSYGYSLADICNQLLEFYEEIGIPLSQGSEAEVAVGGRTKSPASDEQAWKQISSHPVPQHSSAENSAIQFRGTKNHSTDGSKEMGSDITDRKMDLKTKDSQNSKKLPNVVSGDQDRMVGGNLDLRESPLGDSPKEAVKMIAMNEYIAEEGEVIDDDASSLLNSHKRKMDDPPDRQPEMKKQLSIGNI